MKGKILSFAIMAILCGMLMQSCYITKTPVGAYSSQSGMPMRYSKGKQVWLFGLIPLGRTHINTPATDFMIEGKQTFGDYLITFVTIGIIETRTLKCYVKEYNYGGNGYGGSVVINNNQNVNTRSQNNDRNDNGYNNGYNNSYDNGYQRSSQQRSQSQDNSLMGRRVMWTTPQGNTRYGTVTSVRESTCVVKAEDTGSSVVIRTEKLTKIQ